MYALKTMFCISLMLLCVFAALAPLGLSASNENSGGNNSDGNNDDGNAGSSRAAEQLLSLLVLFTGPQNWDYVGVVGVYEASDVSTEQSSSEDVF